MDLEKVASEKADMQRCSVMVRTLIILPYFSILLDFRKAKMLK